MCKSPAPLGDRQPKQFGTFVTQSSPYGLSVRKPGYVSALRGAPASCKSHAPNRLGILMDVLGLREDSPDIVGLRRKAP